MSTRTLEVTPREKEPASIGVAPNAPAVSDTAVVLLNMGGPDSIESIRPFLLNIFRDREIIRLPGGRIGQAALGRLIVRMRLREVQENYEKIGGRSPLFEWTRIQAVNLQAELDARLDDRPIVAMAMRYWEPTAGDTLETLVCAGVKRIVALTLYPHYTRATTGSSVADFLAAAARLSDAPEIEVVDRWPDHPAYLDLWAAKLSAMLCGLEPEVRERVQLVVSAHGLPQRFVNRGDPYVDHVKVTMHGVLERLDDPPPAHLAFQSRTGPVKWIGPGTETVIQDLAAQGHDALVVWPISFVSDHIETTFEVGMLFRETAEDAGVRHYHVVPSFNGDTRFGAVLADLVEGTLRSGGA